MSNNKVMSPRKKRGIFTAFMGAAALVLSSIPGQAEANWPEREIRLLVHVGAGSSADVMARAFARSLENVTGQSVVVDVRGREAMAVLQNAPADGYTFSTQARSYLADLASGRSHFQNEDYQWIARLVGEPFAWGVRADSPWQTFEELVEDAKARPGQIRLSTFRAGSAHQVSALVLMRAAEIELNVIPFDSGAELLVAMLGGNAEIASSNPGALLEHMTAGNARTLVVTSAERVGVMPDVPTAMELGYDVEQNHWRAIIGKAGIPKETLRQIDAAFEAAMQDEVFQDYVRTSGVDLLAQGHEQLNDAVAAEIPVIRQIMQDLGLL